MEIEDQKWMQTIGERKDQLEWWGGERLEWEHTEKPIEGEKR